MLVWGLFAVGTVAGVANLVGVWASTLGYASYYPLGRRDWRFYAFWTLGHVLNGSLLALGYLQWQQLGLPRWATGAGFFLLFGGFVIVIVATHDLGVEETRGLEGNLETDGWYRYSRNPQYLGYMLATIGYPLLVGAPLVVPLCGFYMAWWLSFPAAEERWLQERFGDEYEAYAARVPRFVGFETIRALRNAAKRD